MVAKTAKLALPYIRLPSGLEIRSLINAAYSILETRHRGRHDEHDNTIGAMDMIGRLLGDNLQQRNRIIKVEHFYQTVQMSRTENNYHKSGKNNCICRRSMSASH